MIMLLSLGNLSLYSVKYAKDIYPVEYDVSVVGTINAMEYEKVSVVMENDFNYIPWNIRKNNQIPTEVK